MTGKGQVGYRVDGTLEGDGRGSREKRYGDDPISPLLSHRSDTGSVDRRVRERY